jgi:Glyoxalase/Bleomycin resistance protein/Dioxygenase superfamily
MTIKRLDHISVVVDDLAAAVAFFTTLGMTVEGEAPIEGPWVDRVNGIENIQVNIVMMQTPDGHGKLELTKFRNPKLVEIACSPTAGNSSARWSSTRTSTGSVTCEALLASSSRWPRNSSKAFTAFRATGGALRCAVQPDLYPLETRHAVS